MIATVVVGPKKLFKTTLFSGSLLDGERRDPGNEVAVQMPYPGTEFDDQIPLPKPHPLEGSN